jgi:hypothetical protein
MRIRRSLGWTSLCESSDDMVVKSVMRGVKLQCPWNASFKTASNRGVCVEGGIDTKVSLLEAEFWIMFASDQLLSCGVGREFMATDLEPRPVPVAAGSPQTRPHVSQE